MVDFLLSFEANDQLDLINHKLISTSFYESNKCSCISRPRHTRSCGLFNIPVCVLSEADPCIF